MGKKGKPTVPVQNRKALSRREREDRFRRWLYIGGGVVLAVVLALAAVVVYQLTAAPVATVNGKPISISAYRRQVQYRRLELANQARYIDSRLSQLDPNDADQQGIYNYLAQARQQLVGQAMTVGEQTLEDMIRDELVRQEAARRGIAMTPDEVQKAIEQQFGYNREPAATPTPGASTSPATPTPVTAAIPITTTPEPTATPVPTPTPMTEQDFQRVYRETLDNLRKGAGYTEADFRLQVTTDLLWQKLQEAMASEVLTTGEQIHVRHILLEKEEDAKVALERIQKGEDFATVAKEVSTDTGSKETGGDLGWYPRGLMVDEFDQAAFALQPGQVSDVVTTEFGYHIIKVDEREANRPLDENALQQKRSQALSDWLSEQSVSSAVKRYWSSTMVPAAREPLFE